MTGVFASLGFFEEFSEGLAALESELGVVLERTSVPGGDDGRLAGDALARVEVAFYSHDLVHDSELGRRFLGAALNAPSLRWLQSGSAGLDAPVFGRLARNGVRLTNSPGGGGAEPIAQTAVAGLLMLARGFPAWLEAQRDREWRPHPPDRVPVGLSRQTVLVLGVGAIGNEVARLAQALGLHVIGVRRSPPRAGDHVDELLAPHHLNDLLPRADYLVVASPLTEETRGLIGRIELALLPRGAVLVNVARGEILDETALIEALISGHLAGAYLDVFREEPLPQTSPLWDLPNVLVTPHDSGSDQTRRGVAAAIFLENLRRWLTGVPLQYEQSLVS